MLRSVRMTHQASPPSDSMKPNSDSERNAVPSSGTTAPTLATSETNSAIGTRDVFIGSHVPPAPGQRGNDGGVVSILGTSAAERKGPARLKSARRVKARGRARPRPARRAGGGVPRGGGRRRRAWGGGQSAVSEPMITIRPPTQIHRIIGEWIAVNVIAGRAVRYRLRVPAMTSASVSGDEMPAKWRFAYEIAGWIGLRSG